MSPERTWIRAPLFWARAFFTVLIDLLSWALSCPALMVKDSRKFLPRQDRADVAGEACHRLNGCYGSWLRKNALAEGGNRIEFAWVRDWHCTASQARLTASGPRKAILRFFARAAFSRSQGQTRKISG